MISDTGGGAGGAGGGERGTSGGLPTHSRVSPSPSSVSGVGPTRKALAVVQACDFCRKRKIRCDGLEPCANCEKRRQGCVYTDKDRETPPAKRPRVTAIDTSSNLEDENRHLRAIVRDLQLQVARVTEEASIARANPPASFGSGPTSTDAATHSPFSRNEHTGLAEGMHVAIDGQSSFRGHTSIFGNHEAGQLQTAENSPHLRPALCSQEEIQEAETVLGEAALRGRQQEILDLAAGRLDFDGLDPEVGMELLSIHWNRQHHALLLTYRPLFMRDMAAAGGGQYFSKLLLNAIYFGASKFSTRPELRAQQDDPRTAGFQFLRRINELMGQAITCSRIPTVQALLLLASSLFALGQHQSSWLYSGLAFRMILDLGLHIDSTAFDRTLTPEDIEVRRRLLYGSYCFDKIHSLYQGRPPTLRESDIKVPLVFADTYEETELWRPAIYPPGSTPQFRAGSPLYSVSTFTALCRLCLILGKALDLLYSLDSFSYSPATHLNNLKLLEAELENFQETLPSHLYLDVRQHKLDRPPPPNVLALHAVHSTLVIIVHRPFVAHGHIRGADAQIAESSWQRCAAAAERTSELLRIYQEVLGIKKAPFLISYCAYIAATVHVRLVAQHGPNINAMRKLRFCMDLFRETETVNTGVSRATEVLLSLMRRLDVSTDVSPVDSTSVGGDAGGFDLDALIRSFANPDDQYANSYPQHPLQWQSNSDQLHGAATDDVLYGLMSGGNSSTYDHLFRDHVI